LKAGVEPAFFMPVLWMAHCEAVFRLYAFVCNCCFNRNFAVEKLQKVQTVFPVERTR